MEPRDRLKRAAAERALDFVENGMVLGLGTGSTAAFFVAQLAARVAAGLTIDGKIEGAGHVRMAGRFKGDVNVDGDLTIEPGAKITGSVRASTVTIGGDLEGNIEGASRVELLASGVLNGDLKAGSLTVASGSRMRGNVAFGDRRSGTEHDELGATPSLRCSARSHRTLRCAWRTPCD